MNLLVFIGDRLREERQRLDLNQTQLGELGGVTKKTQMLYESGDRFPDAAYLAAIASAGADVRYIVTGDRDGPAPQVLSPDEQVLLDGYRALDKKTQKRMLAFVLGGETTPETGIKSPPKISIGGSVEGQVVEGGLVNKAPVTIGGKHNKKK